MQVISCRLGVLLQEDGGPSVPHGGLLSCGQVRADHSARLLVVVPFSFALGSWDELDRRLRTLYINLSADSCASHSELLL